MNEVVKEMYIYESVSRNGKPYSNLVIEFKSGYTYRTFLNDEQLFSLKSSGLEVRK